MEKIWQDCLNLLEKETDDPSLLSVAQSFNQVKLEDNRLTLYAPSRWIYDQLNESLMGVLRGYLNRVGGKDVFVNVCITKGVPEKAQLSSVYESSNLKTRFSFKNLIQGENNQMPFELCSAIDSGEALYKHFVIFGGVGLGKTHLIQAAGNTLLVAKPNSRVRYYHSEIFIDECVRSMRERKADEFVEKIRNLDCFLLDDFQFLIGKEASLNLLLHTLDYFIMNDVRFVIVCDQNPKEIKNLDPKIKSRLCGMLSCRVDPPDLKTRVRILELKAQELNLTLDEESLHYIATNITSNVRELEGAVKRVCSAVSFCGMKLNIHTVQKVLEDIVSTRLRIVSIHDVASAVAKHFCTSLQSIASKSRQKNIVFARHIYTYLCAKMTRESIVEVGNFIRRDHTTVRYSVKKIEQALTTEPKVAEAVDLIKNDILGC